MGTSEQVNIGSPDFKRKVTLHHEKEIDAVVSISKDWKSKARVAVNPHNVEGTHDRLFSPDRQRFALPRLKEKFNRQFDIVTGVQISGKSVDLTQA